MNLASTRLVTSDVSALAAFYSTLLGIAPVGVHDYAEFETASGTLAISSQRSVDLFSAGAAVPERNQTVILEFEVEDVNRERIRLRTLVTRYVMEPTDHPWGSRSMLLRDPDGNLISIFSNLPSRSTVR